MPITIIADKICSHCGGNKWYVYKRKYKDKIYTKYVCNVRQNDNAIRWRENNPERYKAMRNVSKQKNKHKYIEKEKESQKRHYILNKDIYIERAKKWKENNLDRWKEIRKRVDDKASVTLSNRYIKMLICDDGSLKHSDVSQELIDIQRHKIQLKRQLKTQKHGNS